MLWYVAVLALIVTVLGGVVRYKVLADRFAVVDRTLAERAHAGRALAELDPPVILTSPSDVRSRLLDPIEAEAEGSLVGSKPVLPPLQPRIIPRDRAAGSGAKFRDEPWDRQSYVRSLAGRTVYSTVQDGRWPVRVLSMPIERQGEVDRVLQLAFPLDGVLREVDELTSTLLTLMPFALLAAGLGGAFLAGRALRPVREIAGTAARLGASDLSERLPVAGRDEFSELSSSINSMLSRLDEAFDQQRRFTADASHELRTPLSIIRANTSLGLEHRWPEERYREFLVAIDAAAGRQSRIVEELLFLARADAGKLARDVGPVCLLDVLEEAAEAVSRPDRPCIRLESIDPALMVRGSGSELTRLFTNLMENAARHTPSAGLVLISAVVEAEVSPFRSRIAAKASHRSTCRTSGSGSTGSMPRDLPERAPAWVSRSAEASPRRMEAD